jgi:hypothetical protein
MVVVFGLWVVLRSLSTQVLLSDTINALPTTSTMSALGQKQTWRQW